MGFCPLYKLLVLICQKEVSGPDLIADRLSARNFFAKNRKSNTLRKGDRVSKKI